MKINTIIWVDIFNSVVRYDSNLTRMHDRIVKLAIGDTVYIVIINTFPNQCIKHILSVSINFILKRHLNEV